MEIFTFLKSHLENHQKVWSNNNKGVSGILPQVLGEGEWGWGGK